MLVCDASSSRVGAQRKHCASAQVLLGHSGTRRGSAETIGDFRSAAFPPQRPLRALCELCLRPHNAYESFEHCAAAANRLCVTDKPVAILSDPA